MREYRRALRLWRWIERNGRGIISGLPGGGKSTYVLASLRYHDGVAVFAVPLRELRDQLYRRIKNDAMFATIADKTVVFRAHDEVCPSLRERVQEGMTYLRALAEHLTAVEQGEEECAWRDHVKSIIGVLVRREQRVVVTTHSLAFMIMMLTWIYRSARRHTIFIYDEAEELLARISERLFLNEVEDICVINEKVCKRLKALFRPPHESMRVGWIPSDLVKYVINNSIFISASFPPTLIEAFERVTADEYPEYLFRQHRAKDTITMYEGILGEQTYKLWSPRVHAVVAEIVETAVDAGWATGIVAKWEKQAEDLTRLLEGRGFTVWSDHRVNLVSWQRADVVIIRPSGPGHRGISFFTRRNRDPAVRDFRVILAFFQAKGIERADVHPFFYSMLEDNPADPEHDEIGRLIEELVYARNFQSLFRFNRFSNHSHVMILFDWRFWKALTMYAHNYFYRNAERYYHKDIDALVADAKRAILAL